MHVYMYLCMYVCTCVYVCICNTDGYLRQPYVPVVSNRPPDNTTDHTAHAVQAYCKYMYVRGMYIYYIHVN